MDSVSRCWKAVLKNVSINQGTIAKDFVTRLTEADKKKSLSTVKQVLLCYWLNGHSEKKKPLLQKQQQQQNILQFENY